MFAMSVLAVSVFFITSMLAAFAIAVPMLTITLLATLPMFTTTMVITIFIAALVVIATSPLTTLLVSAVSAARACLRIRGMVDINVWQRIGLLIRTCSIWCHHVPVIYVFAAKCGVSSRASILSQRNRFDFCSLLHSLITYHSVEPPLLV
jgi:hypothetical protein